MKRLSASIESSANYSVVRDFILISKTDVGFKMTLQNASLLKTSLIKK